MAKEQIYKDLDLTFDVNPLSGDIIKKFGVDAIKQSMKNIIFYNIFEKPYSSEFDVGVKNLLFENRGSGFRNFLEKRVRILLETYEPRISIEKILVKSGNDDNSVSISIYYTPKETQNMDSLELFLGKYNG